MSENEMSMEELLSQYDLKTLRTGELVKGTILKATSEYILVNINYMKDGIIEKKNLCNEDENIEELFHEGDSIEAVIESFDDGEGNVSLSKKSADERIARKNIKKAFDKNEEITLKVKEEVKGGLVSEYGGMRVFIPASHASVHRVELKDLIGKEFKAEIIELDLNKNRVVASIKAVEKKELEAKKEKLWDSLNKGETRCGTVVKLMSFGAFVDLGGIEGLVHLNDLSWKRVNKPEEVVSVGDKVNVYVIDFDRERNRISLGLKNIEEDPWNKVETELKIGDVVQGKVLKFINIGAFVEVMDGIEGLVHISEICEDRIAKPSEKLEIGQMVNVKVLDINAKNKRISLSIKDAVEKPKEDYSMYNESSDEGTSLAELLGNKLKDLKLD